MIALQGVLGLRWVKVAGRLVVRSIEMSWGPWEGRGARGPYGVSIPGSSPALWFQGAGAGPSIPASRARGTLLLPKAINLVMLWKVFSIMTLSLAHIFNIVCLT